MAAGAVRVPMSAELRIPVRPSAAERRRGISFVVKRETAQNIV